ncbi:MAG: LLM class flavin-dependent oxidoreductase [Hyphomicrobiaceae bacterium]
MALALAKRLSIGIQTIHRISEPATAPWRPSIDELIELVRLVDEAGYDSIWTGDHISFPAQILDPLLTLAQAAVASRRLLLGTGVYLLPLRHPVPVAKQVSTLDHLTEGRLIFGVGVGGEFPKEYQACGVPREERGGRLTEGIGLLRKLWTGEPVSHQGRYYSAFDDVPMRPAARQPGGPPIWCGGRQPAALRRAGTLADGWFAYAITPKMFAEGMASIQQAADEAGKGDRPYGTGHLLFTCLADTYEAALDAATRTLSHRYAMDFRRAAERYAALGTPEQVAARIREFHAAGARHVVLDIVGPYERRTEQIRWFARDVLPRLADLR